MALLDFLKKKKQAEEAKKVEKAPAKVSVAKEKKSVKDIDEVKETEKKVSAKGESASGEEKIDKFAIRKVKNVKIFSYEVINRPHISEKATYLAEDNQYVFIVSPRYNKNEIKKAVEGLYKVEVSSVNIIKVPAKKRRIGKTKGFRKGFVKAIVKTKGGQKIEIL